MTSELPALAVSRLASVAQLGRAAWDGVAVARQAIPFLHHGFLSALEDAGALGPRVGWVGAHLAISAGGAGGPLLGIAPAYVKGHSLGEFVYDWAWAEAAERAGGRYYPKLVLAAPFSPVTGERLLVTPGLDPELDQMVREALLMAAVDQARALGCSGVHLLFCTEDEARLAEGHGFVHRLGCQFHWENEGYPDFEAFLARFDSKRRNQVRRERRRVSAQGVSVRSYVASEVEDAFVGPAFDFYARTIERFAWGRRYLNRRVFELLWERMRPYLQLTLAWRQGDIVGGALNLESLPGLARGATSDAACGATRYGRYWGALAEVDGLHFEVCAYAAIEDCIRRGIKGFEAGAGGEEHKLGRGFLPHRTHSVHLLFEPGLHRAIADYCAREAKRVERDIVSRGAQVFVR